MPSTPSAPEPDAARLRALMIGGLLAAAVIGLFGWRHPGHDIDWPRYAVAVLLVDGASFVVLGIVCFMLPAIASWPLSAHRHWLGGFALLHGGKDLFEAWQLALPRPSGDLAWIIALWRLGSFLPLLEFARRLWHDDASPQAALRRWLVSQWLYAGLTLLATALALALGALPAVDVAASCLVALPGAGLSALWLWRRSDAVNGGQGAATVAAVAMGTYALLAGLVVDGHAVTPAWMPGVDGFDAAAGMPVKALRALCAVLVTLAIGRLAMIRMAKVAAEASRSAAELARQVERQTRANALAHLALDSAQDAIAISDGQGRLTDVNASFLSAWGDRNADEVLGTHASEHWPLPEPARPVIEALDREARWEGELDALRSDGRTTPVRVAAGQVRDADGRPVAMMATFHDLTEVRRARQEERLQRAFYEAIVEHAGTMVLVLDAALRIVRFNHACESVSGRSSAQVLGRHPWEVLLPPEQAETAWQQAFAALAADPRTPSRRYTNECLAADGSRRLIDWYNAALLDDDGRMRYVVSVGVDITERRRVESALAHSEQRLNEAQQIAQVGSWDLDLQTGQLLWSDEIFRIVEIEPARSGASCEAYLDRVHPEDRGAVDAAHARLPIDRSPYQIEYRLLMADGRVKWVQQRCVLEFDAAGKALRSLGTVQDITELRLAEQSLRDTQAELERHRTQLEALVHERTGELERQSLRNALIIGTAIDGFFTADGSGRIVEANAAYCDMLGYTREESLSLRVPDIEGDESPAQVAAHIEAVRSRGHDRFESRHRRKDGSLVDVEVSVSVAEVGGEPFFFAFVRDITERRRSERLLRTARDEAEQANRAKSEFLSGMSHELRTPMNAILGFSQLLQMQSLAPQQRDAVGEIYRAGQHLLALIDDLLDLTRIEVGKLAVTAVPVDVAAVVGEALRIVQPMLDARGLGLTNAAPAGLSMLADPVRVRQVLVNLLSNAAKYNRDGGRVSIDVVAPTPQRLRLRVGDTGAGIAPERLSRLFRTFERLGAEHSGVEGSGIGLALSRQLAELMGGTLGVESSVGEGSTFWIELPVTQRIAADPAPLRTAAPTLAAAPFVVLYIEDNPANLKVVELMFQTRPHWRLLTAMTGQEGLESARRSPPDAVLLDIHLPVMDGYAVLRALRSDPRTGSVPVVALSADAMPVQVERGLGAGFHDYLPKPLDLERLMSVMSALAASVPRR